MLVTLAPQKNIKALRKSTLSRLPNQCVSILLGIYIFEIRCGLAQTQIEKVRSPTGGNLGLSREEAHKVNK